VVQARLERPFTSAKDLSNRSKLSTTNIDKLKAAGVFQAMEADETVSLFSFDDEIGKMN
jgi:DNA polymerase III alpha subunit (gram-positive type)